MGPRRTREMVMRLWRIVELVQARRRGITVNVLVEELGASRATVYRDLKLLEEAGVPLFPEPVNGEVRYVLQREALPALRPSATQLAALLLARDLLGPLEGTSLVKELDSLIASRRGEPARAAVGYTPRGTRPSSQLVETIDRALRNGRRVEHRPPCQQPNMLKCGFPIRCPRALSTRKPALA